MLNSQYLVPAAGNFRTPSESLWSYVDDEELLFGIEQQYLITEPIHSYLV